MLLLTLTALAYAQEEPSRDSPKEETQEPAAPAVKLKPEEIAKQVKLLSSRFYADRRKAQVNLARLGEAAIPPLKKVLESDNTMLRMSVVELLGRMKCPEAIPLILKALGDPSLMVHKSAERAVDHYGPELLAGLNKLMDAGKVKEEDLPDALLARLYRKTLVELFSKIEGGGHYPGQYAEIVKLAPRAVPALLLFLDEAVQGTRRVEVGTTSLINALGDIKDKRVIARLEALWRNPNASSYRRPVAMSLAKLGNDKPLNELLKPLLEEAKKPDGNPSYTGIAELYHRTGNYEESQKWFRRAAEKYNSGMHYYNYACALAMGKKLDEAVEALKKGIELGWRSFDWMNKDKEIDPIRKHPGYIEILKKHCPQFLPENLKEKEREEESE
jgi:HEAT repeat protein